MTVSDDCSVPGFARCICFSPRHGSNVPTKCTLHGGGTEHSG